MSVAVSDRVRIAYELRGAGGPVLLIHGLGYGRWGWSPVTAPLAERHTVVLFDNRGLGGSDAPPGPYTARTMAEDAVAVLDAAGLERAHVVGTSLGGMVAQELALGFPERVERLVLACTSPGGPDAFPTPEPTVRLFEEARALEPAAALRAFVANALAPDAPDALVDEITALRIANPPDTAGWYAQAAAAASHDALERLGEIEARTLILHGTEDRVVDVRNAELLAARLAEARVELFPDAGHLFFWEQPRRFVELVTGFLR